MGRWRGACSLVKQIKSKLLSSPHHFSPPHLHSSLQSWQNRISNGHFIFPMFDYCSFSAVPSMNGAYGKEFFSGNEEDEHHNLVGSHNDEVNRIPVKAYFLCTSVDLKGMQAENANNVIPPTSRSSNYVALQYCDLPPEITGLGVAKAACRYMVVFQYGSAVLFNITDHEVEKYLEIVRKHASGLLPDMRKDEKTIRED